MSIRPTQKGHLTPGPRTTVTRIPPPQKLAHLVRQFWIPQWELQPGETVEQLVLGYPASNIVVEPEGIGLYGPTTRASVKVLQDSGWAVGALLRPAGVLLFTDQPAALLDGQKAIDNHDLHESVAGAMNCGRGHRASEVLGEFIHSRIAGMSPTSLRDGQTANQLVDLLDEDPDIHSVADLAVRLHLSQRSIQRLAARYVGMSPLLLLRRRRLQDAAERIRAHPDIDLRELALELGFADQAHLTREFRTVLGFTPRRYPGSQSG
ncbi:helix-turn-helix domain-containing protein [Arthrobacter pigmenti]